MSPLLIWALGSALIGYLGRHRAIGFIGFFLLAFLFSPLVMALVLLVSMPRRDPVRP